MKKLFYFLLIMGLLWFSEVRAESTCKTYTSGSYKINFNTFAKDVSVDSVTVNFPSDTYASLPTPVREGYTFLGWYYDGFLEKKVSTTSVNVVTNPVPLYDDEGCPNGQFEDVTLFANWDGEQMFCATVDGGSFKVVFDVNGGSAIEPMSVPKAIPENLYVDLPTPIKTGYEFVGWYYDGALTQAVGNIKTNQLENIKYTEFASPECYGGEQVTIYAKWSKIQTNEDNPQTGAFVIITFVMLVVGFGVLCLVRKGMGNKILKI